MSNLAPFLEEIRTAVLNGYRPLTESARPAAQSRVHALSWTCQRGGEQLPLACPRADLFDYHHRQLAPAHLFPDSVFAAGLRRDVIYFEVEVEQLHDQAEVVLGFWEDGMLPAGEEPPGQAPNSLGFRARTGEVCASGRVLHAFDLPEAVREAYAFDTSQANDLTGYFFGAGYSFALGLYFFSFNGRVLESVSAPLAAELRVRLHQLKREELVDARTRLSALTLDKVGRQTRLGKAFREELHNRAEFARRPLSLRPAVYVAGAARIAVNAGGAPFQVRSRDARRGLLGG